MSDLISKSALLEKIGASDFGSFDPHNLRGKIFKMVAMFPAADAEPVRHGRWIEEEPAVYKCSECGFTFTTGDPIEKFVYCRCGAKMDGDVNG